jgi:hypothetical protein
MSAPPVGGFGRGYGTAQASRNGQLNFRFAVNGARLAKAVNGELDGLIRTVRHSLW